jgi:hypothetical protein
VQLTCAVNPLSSRGPGDGDETAFGWSFCWVAAPATIPPHAGPRYSNLDPTLALREILHPQIAIDFLTNLRAATAREDTTSPPDLIIEPIVYSKRQAPSSRPRRENSTWL